MERGKNFKVRFKYDTEYDGSEFQTSRYTLDIPLLNFDALYGLHMQIRDTLVTKKIVLFPYFFFCNQLST